MVPRDHTAQLDKPNPQKQPRAKGSVAWLPVRSQKRNSPNSRLAKLRQPTSAARGGAPPNSYRQACSKSRVSRRIAPTCRPSRYSTSTSPTPTRSSVPRHKRRRRPRRANDGNVKGKTTLLLLMRSVGASSPIRCCELSSTRRRRSCSPTVSAARFQTRRCRRHFRLRRPAARKPPLRDAEESRKVPFSTD